MYVRFFFICGFGLKNWRLGVCKVYGIGDGRLGGVRVIVNGVDCWSYFYIGDISFFFGLVWRGFFSFFFVLCGVCVLLRLFIDLVFFIIFFGVFS